MGYREDMACCREYIADSSKDNINAKELANKFGYSYYHFCHVFRAVNGMSVGEYLRDRRLNKAAIDITADKSITSIAFDAGFETLSGFTRAFTKRFGISPSEYKKLQRRICDMEVKIVEKSGFKMAGYVFKGEGEIDVKESGAYWLGQDFSSVSKEDYAKMCCDDYAEVGLWMHPLDDSSDLYYLFGPTIKSEENVPASMQSLEIPGGKFAVFTASVADENEAEKIADDVKKAWKYIFSEWLDKSEYKFDHTRMDFEYYHGKEALIYVPVVEK